MAECYCININDWEWDNKDFVWQDKYFYLLEIKLFFHAPLSLDLKIAQLMREIKNKNFQVDYPVQIFLKDGKFSGQLMVEVKNPAENEPRIRLIKNARGKTFISHQPFHKIKKDIANLLLDFQKKNIGVVNVYLWYAHCPLCVTQKGYQTVIFIQTN